MNKSCASYNRRHNRQKGELFGVNFKMNIDIFWSNIDKNKNIVFYFWNDQQAAKKSMLTQNSPWCINFFKPRYL